jgi:hypothetical protein
MSNYKQIDELQASRLVDCIIVSIGAEDADSITAEVSWGGNGDMYSENGPMPVPQALSVANRKAEELGKDTIYVLIEPDTVGWDVAWGTLT